MSIMFSVLISVMLFVSSSASLSKPLAGESYEDLQAFGNLVSDNMVDFLNRDIKSVAAYRKADGGWSSSLDFVIDGHEFGYGQFMQLVNMLRNHVTDGSVSKVGSATTQLVSDEADALEISYCMLLTFRNIPGVGSMPETVCLITRKYFDDNLIVYKYVMTSDNGFVYNSLFKFLLRFTTIAPDGQSVNYFNNPILMAMVVSIILFTLFIVVAVGWVLSVCKVCKTSKRRKVKGVKYDIVDDTDVSVVSEQEML
eukprot:UN01393